jgi:hypothetical protein
MSFASVSRVPLILLPLIYWGLTTHGKFTDSGDEPHYLMMAQSLWADRDLDLANNYAQDDGARFGAAGLQHELHAIPARDGALRPVHDVGVAVALLPAFVVATTVARLAPEGVLQRFRMSQGLFAYALISFAVMAVVVLSAKWMMAALSQAGYSTHRSAAVVLVVWATLPILANAYEVFPEPFALLATALAVYEWTTPPSSWSRRTWLLVALLGLLPWFHRKYVVYSAALLAVILWRKRDRLIVLGPTAWISAVALFVLPIAALGVWTYHYWGHVGGGLTLGGAPFSLRTFASGAPGLLIDRENGLFWWAPLTLLAPAAFTLDRTRLIWLLPITALIVPAAAHDQWWAGFSPACRFLVPLVPILCLLGADLLRHRTARVAIMVALVPQILFAAYGWQHPHDLWPRGDGHNRVLAAFVGGLADRWLPSFRVPTPSTWPLAISVLALVAALNATVAVRCARKEHSEC